MIRSIPAVDQQGNRVKVGDTIMYMTVQFGEIKFTYATVEEFELKDRGTYQYYVMHVRVLHTDPKHAKRRLKGPTFFKCGVTLEIPTDTIIEGMQE